MIEFADWSGLEIHLVYYPPYHSKYNRIERCWSSLQQKWNGVLLTCRVIVKAYAQRMTWKGQHPTVMKLDGDYAIGVIVPKKEMMELNKRLERSETLAKYDILIRPAICQHSMTCHAFCGRIRSEENHRYERRYSLSRRD